MDNRQKELSSYRLQEAEDSLKVAQNCLDNGFYKDSINRSYYSAFYAIKAILALGTIDFKRHKDVVAYFNKEYVAKGIFSREIGKEKEDFEVSTEDLNALNLTVHAFGEIDGVHMPAGRKTSDWLLCIGAMMSGVRGRRSMNLAAFYENEGDGGSEAGKGLWRQLLPVAVVFGLCAVIFGVVQVRKISLENKLQEKENWIAEMSVSEQYREALISERQVWQVMQTIREIELLQENLATYPKFDAETLADIEGAGSGLDLKIRSYNAESGELNFDANSSDVIDIPGYIMNLERTNLFYKVDYTGYTYQDGVYTLSLVCTMDSPQTGGAE